MKKKGSDSSKGTDPTDSSKYDKMTGAELAALPANRAIRRAAFGTAAGRTPAQAANWRRWIEFNRSQPGAERAGIGKWWNS